MAKDKVKKRTRHRITCELLEKLLNIDGEIINVRFNASNATIDLFINNGAEITEATEIPLSPLKPSKEILEFLKENQYDVDEVEGTITLE